MALNIKNAEVERLASEVAEIANETKTEAIKKALAERRERLSYQLGAVDRGELLHDLLQNEIWPMIPKALLGRALDEDDLSGPLE